MNLNLPDLPEPTERKNGLLDKLGGLRNGVEYDSDILNAKLNQKGLNVQITPVDQFLIELMLKLNGNASIKAQAPFFGGTMQLDANNQGNYGLQSQSPLMGGTLNMKANSDNGNRSARIQWGRTF